MKKTIPINTLSENLSAIIDTLNKDPDVNDVTIIHNNEPVAAIVDFAFYEGLLETIEIYSDPDLVENIRRGMSDLEAGRVKSLEEVKVELGL